MHHNMDIEAIQETNTVLMTHNILNDTTPMIIKDMEIISTMNDIKKIERKENNEIFLCIPKFIVNSIDYFLQGSIVWQSYISEECKTAKTITIQAQTMICKRKNLLVLKCLLMTEDESGKTV